MRLDGIDIDFAPLTCALPAFYAEVKEVQWLEVCRAVREQGGRLAALWGTDARAQGRGFVVRVALSARDGLMIVALSLPGTSYPDVSAVFPSAERMQRAVRDLLGLEAAGAGDGRKWLRHAAWSADEFPLRKDFGSGRWPHHEPSGHLNAGASAASRVTGGRITEQTTFGAPDPPLDAYPFVRVEGEGVHEIPVGPVHAGIIEPGHFRFSVVGETVLRLEERLGYKHKGIEKRFESMTLAEGVRLAGRVSGDSTVAFAWAYSMALESAAEMTPPPRALWLRALLLERERIANHLGDLGFLGNDAALGFGLAQFLRLKEDCLRTHHALFGHRYLMDTIVPGGVARDLAPEGMERLRRETADLERSVTVLKSIYDEHAGLQDRFINCGIVSRELADRLGLTGFAARASGEAWDMRVEFPCTPYSELEVRMGSHRNGDVAARVAVRFEELFESLRLIRLILDRLPLGEIAVGVPALPAGRFGVGWVEGWRGDVLVALETGEGGRIARCHPHDPSWQNWPLLEHAVIGNIVPDFPLINKSFNLSYSGHDL
jgi:Ni,Fe-hydrogenase III large subunit/Ni,Fe-hydrogenase III component G